MSPYNVAKRQKSLQDWLSLILMDDLLVDDAAVQSFLQENREEIEMAEAVEYVGFVYKSQKGGKKRIWASLHNGVVYKYNTPKSRHPYEYSDIRGGTTRLLTATEQSSLGKNFQELALFLICPPGDTLEFMFGVKSEEDRAKWLRALTENDLVTCTDTDMNLSEKESGNKSFVRFETSPRKRGSSSSSGSSDEDERLPPECREFEVAASLVKRQIIVIGTVPDAFLK